MQLLALLWTLIVLFARRRLYTPLLVGVLPPILISIALLSIPSASSLPVSAPGLDEPVLAISSTTSSRDCYPVGVVEGALLIDNTRVETRLLVVKADASKLLDTLNIARGYSLRSGVVLPVKMYESLKRSRVIRVEVDGEIYEYPVACSWRSNLALLVDPDLRGPLELNLCIKRRGDLLVDSLVQVERNLLDTALVWIALLIASYTPILYAVFKRVVESIDVDVRVLLELGSSSRSVTLSVYMALVIVYAVASLYACCLGVVVVYTSWALVGNIIPTPPPTLRLMVLYVLTLYLLVGCLVAIPVSRGVPR